MLVFLFFHLGLCSVSFVYVFCVYLGRLFASYVLLGPGLWLFQSAYTSYHHRDLDVLVKVIGQFIHKFNFIKLRTQMLCLRHLLYYILFFCFPPIYIFTELKAITYSMVDMLSLVSGLESLHKVLVCCDLISDNCIPMYHWPFIMLSMMMVGVWSLSLPAASSPL